MAHIMTRTVTSGLIALAALAAASAARADEAAEAAAYCRRAGDDNRIHAIPDALLPKAAALLGVTPPPDGRLRGVWRCMDGRVMVCIPGGERHCGRADTHVTPSPEAQEFCRQHPDADVIPRWATGRDNIFAWRCRNGKPAIAGQARSVDRRGFVAEYWRATDGTGAGP
ncbi:hypothetical protein ACFFJB_10235 [Camelimonas abortus]|uniref:Peptidase inhibitor family I36 n=1 Tax=Camelimonas abortus TaxID=1017184 RepID=A0ABV7LB68_9HYPH